MHTRFWCPTSWLDALTTSREEEQKTQRGLKLGQGKAGSELAVWRKGWDGARAGSSTVPVVVGTSLWAQHRITELLRLEKIFKIIKSNL